MKSKIKIPPKDVLTLTAHIDLPVTSDEAFEYVYNPKGKIAKELRRYLGDLMTGICKKCLKELAEKEASKE